MLPQPPSNRLSENDLWVLSFYRSSEINGALFFGRVARTIKGPLLVDVTHHFADESNHARWWTQCLADLDYLPYKLGRAYQDQYLDAIGLPANLMEIMAITLVFEKRVIGQYRQHMRYEGTHPAVKQTINRIMVDERWHISYVNTELRRMAERHGEELINDTLKRYHAADEEIYAKTLQEFAERIDVIAENSSALHGYPSDEDREDT